MFPGAVDLDHVGPVDKDERNRSGARADDAAAFFGQHDHVRASPAEVDDDGVDAVGEVRPSGSMVRRAQRRPWHPEASSWELSVTFSRKLTEDIFERFRGVDGAMLDPALMPSFFVSGVPE